MFDFEDEVLTYNEVGEHPNLNRLLKISKVLENITEEPETVKGVIELYRNDKEILDILESFDSLEYILVEKEEGLKSNEKLFGEYVVYELDSFPNLTDKQKYYLDFERIGRDYLFDYYWTETKNYLVLRHI